MIRLPKVAIKKNEVSSTNIKPFVDVAIFVRDISYKYLNIQYKIWGILHMYGWMFEWWLKELLL